jgi:hypothetical protein
VAGAAVDAAHYDDDDDQEGQLERAGDDFGEAISLNRSAARKGSVWNTNLDAKGIDENEHERYKEE